MVTSVPFALLSSCTASCAKCSCSRPTWATGPVNGPSIAMVALQPPLALELDAAATALELPLELLLLLLLLPQPAAISAVSATPARVRRTFIGFTPPLECGAECPRMQGFRPGKTPPPAILPAGRRPRCASAPCPCSAGSEPYATAVGCTLPRTQVPRRHRRASRPRH